MTTGQRFALREAYWQAASPFPFLCLMLPKPSRHEPISGLANGVTDAYTAVYRWTFCQDNQAFKMIYLMPK